MVDVNANLFVFLPVKERIHILLESTCQDTVQESHPTAAMLFTPQDPVLPKFVGHCQISEAME